jgi:hypothetical protein
MTRLAQFKTPQHFLLAGTLLMFSLADFLTRVYIPSVDAQATIAPLDIVNLQTQLSSPQPSSTLKSYFQAADTGQASAAQQAAKVPTVTPLAGSERLGDASYRLRAVLSKTINGDLQQQALLEEQQLEGKEAGTVKSKLLSIGDDVGGYELAVVNQESVTLRQADSQLTLPLFKQQRQQAGTATNQVDTGPVNSVEELLQQADPKDAEELKALLELMKNQ